MCVLSEIKLFLNETTKILFRNKIRYIFLICKIFSYFFSRKNAILFYFTPFPTKKYSKKTRNQSIIFLKTTIIGSF